jgi:hypothetical protein
VRSSVRVKHQGYNEAGRQSQGSGGYHHQTVPLRPGTPRASLANAKLQILSHITLQTCPASATIRIGFQRPGAPCESLLVLSVVIIKTQS